VIPCFGRYDTSVAIFILTQGNQRRAAGEMLNLPVNLHREIPDIFSLPNLLQLEMKVRPPGGLVAAFVVKVLFLLLLSHPITYLWLYDRLDTEQHSTHDQSGHGGDDQLTRGLPGFATDSYQAQHVRRGAY
jgi:hypothetical protein